MAKGKKTGGRIAGTPNKVTRSLKQMAEPYLPEALATIVAIMQQGENPQVRLMAAREVCDRAAGKAPQAITGEGGTGPVLTKVVHEYLAEPVKSLAEMPPVHRIERT